MDVPHRQYVCPVPVTPELNKHAEMALKRWAGYDFQFKFPVRAQEPKKKILLIPYSIVPEYGSIIFMYHNEGVAIIEEPPKAQTDEELVADALLMMQTGCKI
jgi:hypothetical protein